MIKPLARRKKYGILLISALLFVSLFWVALDHDLSVVTYRVESNKLTAPLRLALVTDLHSCDYGEGQKDLLEQLERAEPDLILLGGDILDDELPYEKGLEFLRAIGTRYPCYYVTGNHEFWTGEIKEVKALVRDCAVTVLAGDWATVDLKGQKINLCGVDDPAHIGKTATMAQVGSARKAATPDYFTLLLSHRPELIGDYLPYDFDLILSGHAHGGQWRIPGLLNGFLAPDQGFFPKYAGGLYQLGDTSFIVSRGLAQETTRVPRLFNPPELVIVELTPAPQE